jgi:hypothetical protein
MHHNLEHGPKDRQITTDEFLEYYTNVSGSIDNDAYFELMITNVWNLKGSTGQM